MRLLLKDYISKIASHIKILQTLVGISPYSNSRKIVFECKIIRIDRTCGIMSERGAINITTIFRMHIAFMRYRTMSDSIPFTTFGVPVLSLAYIADHQILGAVEPCKLHPHPFSRRTLGSDFIFSYRIKPRIIK